MFVNFPLHLFYKLEDQACMVSRKGQQWVMLPLVKLYMQRLT